MDIILYRNKMFLVSNNFQMATRHSLFLTHTPKYLWRKDNYKVSGVRERHLLCFYVIFGYRWKLYGCLGLAFQKAACSKCLSMAQRQWLITGNLQTQLSKFNGAYEVKFTKHDLVAERVYV